MKKDLKNRIQEDHDITRGAMLEIMAHNRRINSSLVEKMEDDDFGMLEEYTMLTEGILKAAKLLTDINTQVPKIVKDVDSLQEEKQKIDLNANLEE